MNNTKTKWYPLFRYSHCAAYKEFLVMARADKKTGMFEFKTITICENCIDKKFMNWNFNFETTFNILQKEINNE
ncbi:TPA: hypothetical protein CPT95_00060 [Candidatus Gastranaerophilales bacterium HUM_15]|jgi:hypothetical protein|nr:MAG TPA: hypothetical protein CPT95_00060 [Candidatus Gastranaerophilales bacterium HUM_15]